MNKVIELNALEKGRKAVAKRRSVLVVDDSLDALILMKTVLGLADFQVFTAQSGTDALEVLSEIEEPDLILLDVVMEDMTGPELLTILEQKMPKIIRDVPVVFLTGMDEVPKSKAVGFIRKPADMVVFLEAVHRYIEMGHQEPIKH